MSDRTEKAAPLLALIRKYESDGAVGKQGVINSYDVVWGGISSKDRPPIPLSTMTIAQVLAWQDKIDAKYNSEAAGAYQIMEDTLRGLKFSPSALFNSSTQDELALQLLDRRGWARVEKGTMTIETFADNLAKEWASFPVQKRQQGGSRIVNRGQSYYAGDGLNSAKAKPEEIIEAIKASMVSQPTVVEEDKIAILEARVKKLEDWAIAFSNAVRLNK